MDDHSPHHIDDEQSNGYDALPTFEPSPPDDESGFELAALDDDAPRAAEPSASLFTVTNPPGTVTVTAFMDGRISEVDLSPRATTMTESQLADEIVVIATLATQDARSSQYAFMLDGMRAQGHEDAATRDFLSRDLDLPSPEDADAARASVFATRYAGDHD